MIYKLNKRFLKFSFNEENKSIDESMIFYYRTRDSKQRINNQLIQEGYKTLVLAEVYGYVVQFEPYISSCKERLPPLLNGD